MAPLNTTVVVVVAVLLYYFCGFQQERWDPALIQGKRVLITGASSGIGEQVAYQYAALGANVFITARRENNLKQVLAKCEEIGATDAKHGYQQADMYKSEDVHAVLKTAVHTLGGLDVLILNHASLLESIGFLWEGSEEQVSKMRYSMEVSFMSYILLASDAMLHLKLTNGSIGVISSWIGRASAKYFTPYSSAKHAIEGFFQSLRQELDYRGVNVSITIFPLGNIQTKGGDETRKMVSIKTGEPMVDVAPREECAREIVRAVEGREKECWYPTKQRYWWLILKKNTFFHETVFCCIWLLLLLCQVFFVYLS